MIHGRGLAAGCATLKRRSDAPVATQSQQRFVANCSDFARWWCASLTIAHVPKLNMALTLQYLDRVSIRATLEAIARIGNLR
jgi:hypothetical protein